MPSRIEPEVEEKKEEPAESTRGKIFNSLPSSPKKNEIENKVEEKTPAPPKRESKPVDLVDDMDDEDWGAVPAFLRRSKLK